MSREEILGKVQEVLQEIFDDDALQITLDLTADDVDGWDSLKHITLLAALEDEFNIRFSLSTVRKANNVGDIIEIIEACLS